MVAKNNLKNAKTSGSRYHILKCAENNKKITVEDLQGSF